MAPSSVSAMVARMVMVTAAVVLLVVTGAPPVRAAVDVPACLQPLVSLRSCLDDVSKNPAARSPACCSFFVQLLNATPNCLCDVLEGEGGRWLAITIDVARAVAVLVNCSAEIPKLTKCPNLTWMPPNNTATPAKPPSPPVTPATPLAPAKPPSPADTPAKSPSPAKAPAPAPAGAPSAISGAPPLASLSKLVLVLSLAASSALAIVRV